MDYNFRFDGNFLCRTSCLHCGEIMEAPAAAQYQPLCGACRAVERMLEADSILDRDVRHIVSAQYIEDYDRSETIRILKGVLWGCVLGMCMWVSVWLIARGPHR